jgi:membrane protease YdiL (CAAX protease family)
VHYRLRDLFPRICRSLEDVSADCRGLSICPAGKRDPTIALHLLLGGSAAFFEEVFFVGIFAYVARQFLNRELYPLIVVTAVALLAGSVHWEGGVANLVAATVTFGAAAMLYLRIETLWPLIVAHFVIDLIVLW